MKAVALLASANQRIDSGAYCVRVINGRGDE